MKTLPNQELPFVESRDLSFLVISLVLAQDQVTAVNL